MLCFQVSVDYFLFHQIAKEFVGSLACLGYIQWRHLGVMTFIPGSMPSYIMRHFRQRLGINILINRESLMDLTLLLLPFPFINFNAS